VALILLKRGLTDFNIFALLLLYTLCCPDPAGHAAGLEAHEIYVPADDLPNSTWVEAVREDCEP
jgi:hypothetical protein